jgi:hypothetical protein
MLALFPVPWFEKSLQLVIPSPISAESQSKLPSFKAANPSSAFPWESQRAHIEKIQSKRDG